MRIGVVLSAVLLAWSHSPGVSAQDDLVLHEYPYSTVEIETFYETATEQLQITPTSMQSATVEDGAQLEILASPSNVAAVRVNIAWLGEIDGCGTRLWYSADSATITPQADGNFAVAMEGFWLWDVTSRPAGLTQGVCSEKTQTITDVAATMTVRLQSGPPTVSESTGVAIPAEAWTTADADPSLPSSAEVGSADGDAPTSSGDAGQDDPRTAGEPAGPTSVPTDAGGDGGDGDGDGDGGTILVIALLLVLLLGLIGLGIAGAKGREIFQWFAEESFVDEDDEDDEDDDEDDMHSPSERPTPPRTGKVAPADADDTAADALLTEGILDLADRVVSKPPSESPPSELPAEWRWVWAPRRVNIDHSRNDDGSWHQRVLQPGHWYKAHRNSGNPATWDVYEPDDTFMGEQVSLGDAIRDR